MGKASLKRKLALLYGNLSGPTNPFDLTTALFSPTDHNEFISINVGGTEATRNNTLGGSWSIARSDLSQSSGVRYVQFTVLNVGTNGMMVGLANGAEAINNYAGFTNNGVSYWSIGNTVKNGGFTGITPDSYTTNDVLGMKVDFGAKTVQFNKNGGAFSATIDITSLGDDIFVAVSLGDGASFSSVRVDPMMTIPVGTQYWDESLRNPSGTMRIIAHGDSMSLTGGVLEVYLPRVVDLQTGVSKWFRRGINGASYDYAWPNAGYPLTLIEDALVRVDPYRSGSLTNWLVVFAGTNGIHIGGHSAATEYANFKTYIAARIAAGWIADNIIVCTMLPRTGLNEATRSTYNTSLVGDDGAYGYRLARLDLDPDIGAGGQDLDPTWFHDGIHPTDAGQAIIAQTIFDAMA